MNPFSLLHLRQCPLRTSLIIRRSGKRAVACSRRAHFLLVRFGGEAAEPPPLGTEEVAGRLLEVRVDELLKREENRSLLEGLEAASRRVDRAKAALEDIEKQEAEALRTKELVLQLQSRASEVEETQKELLKARAMVEESEQSLSYKNSKFSQNEEINIKIERWESIKAASISSFVGTLASLPLSLYQANSFTSLALHTAIVFISSALFGVTFRYTIRGDIDNLQLKTGTSAAFGLVKGLAELEAGKPLELNSTSFISIINSAVSVSENIIIFLTAAVALDFCFKSRLLNSFPIRE